MTIHIPWCTVPSQVIKDANDEGWILHCRSLQNVFAYLILSSNILQWWCKGTASFAEAIRFAWCSLEPGGSMLPAQLWSAEQQLPKTSRKGLLMSFSVSNKLSHFLLKTFLDQKSCSVGMVSAAETTAITTLEFMQYPQALTNHDFLSSI